MKLVSTNGDFFELLIKGYQFPENIHHSWDSNWLFMQINVSMEAGSWNYIDPCLLTYEMEEKDLPSQGNQPAGSLSPGRLV